MMFAKLRCIKLLVLLGFTCLSAAKANNLHDAFKEYFGHALGTPTSRATLVGHLDTLLALGASKPGEKLLHLHEYSDSKAYNLGTTLKEALAPNSINEWADRVGAIVPKLDELQSFPMLRRLIVAAILKYWIQQNDQNIPDETEEKLTSLLVKLYDKHRQGAIHKGAMEYLHISKSGGTSWCHIAQLNGCTTERYDKSYVCQIKKFDDKVRWLNMTYHMLQVPVYRVPKYVLKRFSRFGSYRKNHDAAACAARARFVTNHGYNYYSNEYTVHGGHRGVEHAHMCSSFFNAIVMRDPLKRLVSHMKFVMWTMSGDRGYNDTQLFNRMYANRTSTFWQELGPAMVDNYFIRSLLGEAAFHVPVGAVDAHMLQLAQLMLAQFDLVLVLEQEPAVRNLILHYGVGWSHTFEAVHDKDSGVREAAFNTTGYIPNDVDRLLSAQTLDVELYQFAGTLAQLDPVVFSVARRAGIEPLPRHLLNATTRTPTSHLNTTGTNVNITDGVQCGLLHGQNKSQLLTAMGYTTGRRARRVIETREQAKAKRDGARNAALQKTGGWKPAAAAASGPALAARKGGAAARGKAPAAAPARLEGPGRAAAEGAREGAVVGREGQQEGQGSGKAGFLARLQEHVKGLKLWW